MDQSKIGQLIKKIRKENHLTQQEFASRYGVTYQAVSKWENGKNIPDVALLKQICEDYHMDLNDFLDGDYIPKKDSKDKKSWLWLILLFVILIGSFCLLFFLFYRDDNFEFKTLSSDCDMFTITGSLAYNARKSSIYISNIDYCGGEDDALYTRIECALYGSTNSYDTKISGSVYENENGIRLEDYLQDFSINASDYSRNCAEYINNSLYLEIIGTTIDGEEVHHHIPLSLNGTCSLDSTAG